MGGRGEPDLTAQRARALRKTMPSAEELVWWKLRGRRDDGLKFRRQHPVPPYILDFAERKRKLAVQIDGHTHGEFAEIAYDAYRTAYLEDRGLIVMRIGNDEVYEDLDEVVNAIIVTALEVRGTPPIDPRASSRPTSPRKRGEG